MIAMIWTPGKARKRRRTLRGILRRWFKCHTERRAYARTVTARAAEMAAMSPAFRLAHTREAQAKMPKQGITNSAIAGLAAKMRESGWFDGGIGRPGYTGNVGRRSDLRRTR